MQSCTLEVALNTTPLPGSWRADAEAASCPPWPISYAWAVWGGSKGRAAARQHGRLKARKPRRFRLTANTTRGRALCPCHRERGRFVRFTRRSTRQLAILAWPPRQEAAVRGHVVPIPGAVRSWLPVINVNNAAPSEGDGDSGDPCPKCCHPMMSSTVMCPASCVC